MASFFSILKALNFYLKSENGDETRNFSLKIKGMVLGKYEWIIMFKPYFF